MAIYENVRPGKRIYPKSGAKGTLACFATKDGKLFGVTAKHVLSNSPECNGINEAGSLPIVISTTVVSLPGIDLAYFELLDEVRKNFTGDNFIPVTLASEPLAVWDPQMLRNEILNAKTSKEEDALSARRMPVFHFGATQLESRLVATKGELQEKYIDKGALTKISNTVIDPGDSGGPVIDVNKMCYAGVISTGTGEVVVCKVAFEKAGLTLATWRDRSAWQTWQT